MAAAFFVLLVCGLLLVIVVLMMVTMILQMVWYVPFVPTGNPVLVKMMNMAELKPNETVYDLGVGDARTLIEAKKREPGIRAVGYEVTFLVWLLAKFSVWKAGLPIEIRQKNFMNANLHDADVIFLYLSPTWMDLLAPKFDRELKPGTRVLSHAFPFRDREAMKTVRVAFPHSGNLGTVFYYEWGKQI